MKNQIIQIENIEEFEQLTTYCQHLGEGQFEVSPFVGTDVIQMLAEYDAALSNLRKTEREVMSINSKIEKIDKLRNQLLKQPVATWKHTLYGVEQFDGKPPLFDGIRGDLLYATRHKDFCNELPFVRLIGRFDDRVCGTSVFEIGTPITKYKNLLAEFFESQEQKSGLQHRLTEVHNFYRSHAADVVRLHSRLNAEPSVAKVYRV